MRHISVTAGAGAASTATRGSAHQGSMCKAMAGSHVGQRGGLRRTVPRPRQSRVGKLGMGPEPRRATLPGRHCQWGRQRAVASSGDQRQQIAALVVCSQGAMFHVVGRGVKPRAAGVM